MVDIVLGFSLFDWVLGKLPDFIKSYIPQILLNRLKPLADAWQSDGEKILSTKIAPLLAPLRPVLHVLGNLKDSTIGLWGKIDKLTKDAVHEYKEIKNFKEDLHWRGRVINAPEVVKKIKRLTEIPSELFRIIQELTATIREQSLLGKSPGSLAEEAAQSLEGIEEFRGLLQRFVPKLAKGAEKLLGVLAIIVDAIVLWNTLVDDLQKIVDDVKEVRLDLEKLDLIFLPQNNARRYVKLEDGRTIRIRVGGHLHPK